MQLGVAGRSTTRADLHLGAGRTCPDGPAGGAARPSGGGS
ncbi:hypothetical protein Ae356Ps1_0028 [Pseudonocardia sp. Ae356_Ps1]|nr:hypothetical protein Ae356Ps1_0028 [Pseudonocardia sp. Ae356_Ps1]